MNKKYDNNEIITKSRGGHPYQVSKQVVLWRSRMRRFRKLYKQVLSRVLDWHGNDEAATEAWFKTPHAQLGGSAPKAFLNPKQIGKLHKWIFGIR